MLLINNKKKNIYLKILQIQKYYKKLKKKTIPWILNPNFRAKSPHYISDLNTIYAMTQPPIPSHLSSPILISYNRNSENPI